MSNLEYGYFYVPGKSEELYESGKAGAQLWADYLGVPNTTETRKFTQEEDSRLSVKDKLPEEISDAIGKPVELWNSLGYLCLFVADEDGRIFKIRANELHSFAYHKNADRAERFDTAMMELRKRVDPSAEDLHFFYPDSEGLLCYIWNKPAEEK